MVSWGAAFKAAGLTIIYSILWGIVGLLLCIIGIGVCLASATIRDNGYGVSQITWGSTSVIGIIMILTGILISSLASLATIYKIGSELMAEEIRTKGSTESGPPGSGTYCRRCGTPNPEGSKFCGNCGAQLR